MRKLRTVKERSEHRPTAGDLRGLGDDELITSSGIRIVTHIKVANPAHAKVLLGPYGLELAENTSNGPHRVVSAGTPARGSHKVETLRHFVGVLGLYEISPELTATLEELNEFRLTLQSRLRVLPDSVQSTHFSEHAFCISAACRLYLEQAGIVLPAATSDWTTLGHREVAMISQTIRHSQSAETSVRKTGT